MPRLTIFFWLSENCSKNAGIVVEASLQLPVIRDLKSTVEPDFVFVIGTRITW